MQELSSLAEVRRMLQLGNVLQARAVLMELVRTQGRAAPGEAWWLLGETLSDPAQQEDCYSRARAAGYSPQAPRPAAVPANPAPAPTQLVEGLQRLQPAPAPAPSPAPAPTSLVDRLRVQAAAPAPSPAPAAQAAYVASSPTAASPYSEEQINFVVDLLGQHLTGVDLIRPIMVSYNYAYADAQALVNHVQTVHKQKVAQKQLPMVAYFALIGFIAGMAGSYYLFSSLAHGVIPYSLIPYWWPIYGFIWTSPALVVGSVWGLIKAIGKLGR